MRRRSSRSNSPDDASLADQSSPRAILPTHPMNLLRSVLPLGGLVLAFSSACHNAGPSPANKTEKPVVSDAAVLADADKGELETLMEEEAKLWGDLVAALERKPAADARFKIGLLEEKLNPDDAESSFARAYLLDPTGPARAHVHLHTKCPVILGEPSQDDGLGPVPTGWGLSVAKDWREVWERTGKPHEHGVNGAPKDEKEARAWVCRLEVQGSEPAPCTGLPPWRVTHSFGASDALKEAHIVPLPSGAFAIYQMMLRQPTEYSVAHGWECGQSPTIKVELRDATLHVMETDVQNGERTYRPDGGTRPPCLHGYVTYVDGFYDLETRKPLVELTRIGEKEKAPPDVALTWNHEAIELKGASCEDLIPLVRGGSPSPPSDRAQPTKVAR